MSEARVDHALHWSEMRTTMAIKELHIRARELREALWAIDEAPDDKSLHQVREEAIVRELDDVREEGRNVALQDDIHAAGTSPDQCIIAAANFKGWGAITDIQPLDGGDPKYTWGRTFYADGTSMKAAGWEIPGGFIMTWWK